MKMGPDFRPPETGISIPGSYQYAPAEYLTPQSEERWWEIFGDHELNQIVDEALRNNLDIKKATARILEVRSQFVQVRSDRFPNLSLQGQVQRQRQTINTTIPVLQGQTLQMQSIEETQRTTNYNMSLAASFELDLWGRLARAEEAARADLLQAEESRHTVTQTVVAETRSNLALLESRYERGLTSSLDPRQASRILAQAEALLPSLRQDLGITQQKLAVLLGHYPDTRPPRIQQEDYFKLLSPVPPGLPSDLLLRRPDIRTAEARLRALNAQVGVAKASRFPRITLTGNFGYLGDELDRLFKPQSELWNLALGIVQPLFDAGKLKAGQRAAEARYQQGVAEYAKTVLTAFSDVEGALLTRREQLERRDHIVDFLEESRATQRVAENRYNRGLIDFLNVLEAQRTRFEAEESLVLVDLAIYTNRVTLHRALGGGWGELCH
jgi:multidrug efflux system outer membrane protein